ncbi:YadA C-terminal domain-containing protein [Vibrio sp. SCSIO 43132]|uniref:YadA C-terminal domain-containing protein n=1 Tax=Vibrio sp. SCSIO 43132 TaxID=2779363 RepID=UPI001CA94075|nr:YadA C-terminal domain-containing protein [Vibrio sp. SCSIO 43132]UAB72873.1 YadA C-terminal domain-containing protein [Vibrio sp. SCSIO 43132]
MKKSLIALSLVSVFSAGAMAATAPINVGTVDDVVEWATDKNLNLKIDEQAGTARIVREIKDRDGKVIESFEIADISIDAKNIDANKGGTITVNDIHENGGSVDVHVDSEGNVTVLDNSELPDIDSNNERRITDLENSAEFAGKEIINAASAIEGRVDSLETRFNDMAERQHRQEMRINENEGKMSNGIAGVAAMANIPTVSGKTTFGAGVGHFNGSNAIAIGASTGFENGISLKGSLSYAKGKWDQKDVVVGAGIGYSF